jgi:transposase
VSCPPVPAGVGHLTLGMEVAITMVERGRRVVGGVDTHKDVHVVAAVDDMGRILGTAEFASTIGGHRALLAWLKRFGPVVRVGVEGTGAYGAGLARYLAEAGVEVVEVDRPNRQTRRRKGKSDPVDAEAAARAALSGEASGRPKAGTGAVEMIRALRVARRSARKARVQAVNQIRDLVITAPDELRSSLRDLALKQVVDRAVRWRPGPVTSPTAATKLALTVLAQRYQALGAEIDRLDTELDRLVAETAGPLLERKGLGTDTIAALLIAAGDNPQRLKNEASFAALCGASPVDASSGKQQRHRLNRAGDRQANEALWRVVLVRMSTDPRTKDYVGRRLKEGKTKKEAIRCLKRYVAREVYRDLIASLSPDAPTPTRPKKAASRVPCLL